MDKEMLKLIIQIIILITSLVFIGFIIYTLVKYVNTPVNELPTWVWWLLH